MMVGTRQLCVLAALECDHGTELIGMQVADHRCKRLCLRRVVAIGRCVADLEHPGLGLGRGVDVQGRNSQAPQEN